MLRRILTVIVPWLLASTVGALVLIHFFVSWPGLDPLFNGLVQWASIIAAFAILLGLVNVARTHGQKILRREKGWPYSLVLILAALAVIIVGLFPPPTGYGTGPGDPRVRWVFYYVLAPLSTTFFSLLAFFLTTAIFRSLRLRNLETSLLTIAAVIVLLGSLPTRSQWPFLQPLVRLQEWLLRVPAMAGIRAILIGAAIGAIATAMRVVLGLERPYAE
ncbi:MAG: hypothetical protein JXA37_07025 [Chloroflexia bacterium]|nr:hypothetical protein [Chloroflexia bacterium]